MNLEKRKKTPRWKSTLAPFENDEVYIVSVASGDQREIAIVHDEADARIIALVPNMLDYINARAAAGDRNARALKARARHTLPRLLT